MGIRKWLIAVVGKFDAIFNSSDKGFKWVRGVKLFVEFVVAFLQIVCCDDTIVVKQVFEHVSCADVGVTGVLMFQGANVDLPNTGNDLFA